MYFLVRTVKGRTRRPGKRIARTSYPDCAQPSTTGGRLQALAAALRRARAEKASRQVVPQRLEQTA
ncbi:hypothetical protein [Streptomyces lavendofoliae]|uniref:hypothetical protein n=1 Tax=Streptomyces lavendofoliae TaxID=67314 RepID=UPI003D90A953